MEGKVICEIGGREVIACSSRVNHGLCIASCLHSQSSGVKAHKHKRENFLFLCDALGDFALGCFFSKRGGSKVIGSSE